VTPLNLILVIILECCDVAGQICFKKAMVHEGARAMFQKILALGIGFKALEFFLWTGLLAKFELSFLYPFDALNRIGLLIAASVFLKEKASPQLWLGVGLIAAGVALVSST
jgi:drug/metabolite transporter (DMT)-like permease